MLKNGDTPIPIKQHYLGNDNCNTLVLSGHAVTLPLMVDDIADALYWLQGIFTSIAVVHTQCHRKKSSACLNSR
jgi:hypothetical protein